jgi:mono/diheme cytochrome c family protein
MDRIDFFQVNRSLYPRFDESTKQNARLEVFATFSHLLQHNAPLSDLLKADYVIVNHLLANFYGIEGATGDPFQKVSLPAGSPRGGLLGMAAIQFMGGNGERTSPVERGAWVLRKLLNDPPPPAPANIPQLARLAGKVLTTHERLVAHQEDAQCASCHRRIDPIGFGLENFDAVGQWRTEDSYQVMDEKGRAVPNARKTWTIDTAAAFYKGPAFKDYFELRNIIASKSDAFARGFSQALLEYSLGRTAGFRDESLLAEMVASAKKENLGVRNFVAALVGSTEFRTK